jgi:hypothetical protein
MTASTPGVAGDVAVLGDYITTPRDQRQFQHHARGDALDNLNGYTLTGSQTITPTAAAGRRRRSPSTRIAYHRCARRADHRDDR